MLVLATAVGKDRRGQHVAIIRSAELLHPARMVSGHIHPPHTGVAVALHQSVNVEALRRAKPVVATRLAPPKA